MHSARLEPTKLFISICIYIYILIHQSRHPVYKPTVHVLACSTVSCTSRADHNLYTCIYPYMSVCSSSSRSLPAVTIVRAKDLYRVQIQPRKHILHAPDSTAPSRHHELDLQQTGQFVSSSAGINNQSDLEADVVPAVKKRVRACGRDRFFVAHGR